ncbi:MAG: hypothetical protein RI989_1145, partial [Bacteroidota bacterium]
MMLLFLALVLASVLVLAYRK